MGVDDRNTSAQGAISREGEDRYRAARAIERRGVNKLVVHCGVEILRYPEIVVRLQDFLAAVIQGAITGENAGASGSQELLVAMRNTAGHAPQAECVGAPGAMPHL